MNFRFIFPKGNIVRQFWKYNTFILLLFIHFYLSFCPIVPSAYSGSPDKTTSAYCKVNIEPLLTIFWEWQIITITTMVTDWQFGSFSRWGCVVGDAITPLVVAIRFEPAVFTIPLYLTHQTSPTKAFTFNKESLFDLLLDPDSAAVLLMLLQVLMEDYPQESYFSLECI